jgi:microcompartment protein CcmL/EutN
LSDPAVAILEFDSISAGIVAGDAMVKAAPVGAIYAGTIHPGKYLVLVTGDTASVEIARDVGSEAGAPSLVDSVFLPDVHPDVVDGLTGRGSAGSLAGNAAGIVETSTVAAVVDAGDAGVKAADVSLAAISLADGLGGKGYLVFAGVVAEVEAAVDAAVARVGAHGTLIRSDVIAQMHSEMADNLLSDLRFLKRIGDL